jgi:YVTN family beta-propeller protein
MRRAAPAGVLLCGIASAFLISCNEDTPTSIPAGSGEPSFAASTSCDPSPFGKPGKIIEQVLTPAAWGVAVRNDGLTYFAQPFNGGVGITSTKTRTVNGFIPTGANPIGVAFSPSGATAYVTNLESQNVSIIDVATAQQVGTIPTEFTSPFVVRVSPDGTRLYIATSGNLVFIVETATHQIIKTVEVGDSPNAFAVHPDGRMMYVSSFSGGTVSEIDMITETVLRTFPVGGTPQDMAVNRRGTRLYVANEQGYLNEIDLATGEQLPNIPLAGGGFGLGVTRDDAEAYVSIPGAGLVQVFDLKSRKFTRAINVGGDPRRIAFSEQGTIGAIANMAGYLTFVR